MGQLTIGGYLPHRSGAVSVGPEATYCLAEKRQIVGSIQLRPSASGVFAPRCHFDSDEPIDLLRVNNQNEAR